MTFLISLLLLSSSFSAEEVFRLQLTPYDFQNDTFGYHFDSIFQLESQDGKLFIRSNKEPVIAIVEPGREDGRIIGSRGQGPEEFGYLGVLAMAIYQDELWAIDSDRKSLRFFKDGEFVQSNLLDSFNHYHFLPTSNAFGVSEEWVVVPAAPSTGKLAAVYDKNGGLVKHVGDPFPVEDWQTMHIPGIQDSLWRYQDNRWYCLHKFLPYLTVFDENFQVQGQFHLKSAAIDKGTRAIEEFEPNQNLNVPIPLFTDFQIYDGHLYTLGLGWLHQIGLANGETRWRASFHGEGLAFAGATGAPVTLYTFAFLGPRKIVLGHPVMPWGHELWLADLTFTSSKQSTQP